MAVSAPWGGEDGNGVVYIYNVRAGKLVTTPSQVRNYSLVIYVIKLRAYLDIENVYSDYYFNSECDIVLQVFSFC